MTAKTKKKEWLAIPKRGSTIPFGYMEHPDDPDILLPVEKELELLEQAKLHVRQYSYRAVAEWLTENSGRYISHVGLSKRISDEKKRLRSRAALIGEAKRLEKVLAAIRKIETEYPGSRAGSLADSFDIRRIQTGED